MNKQKSIKFNFYMNLLRVLMSILFPLITYPYAARVLGKEGVGQAAYVASIVSYFQLIAAFGVNNYAITEGAKIRDDKEKLNRFATDMFFVNIVFTIIAYVLFAGALMIPKFDGYEVLLIISSSSIILTTMGMSWLFELLEEYTYITICSVIGQFISLVMMFVLVRGKADVIWYVVLVVVSTAGSYIVNFFYSKKFVKLFSEKIDFNELKVHLKPMLYMFGVSIASVIYINSDITMLGYMKGDGETGIYNTATKVNQVVCTLIKSLSTVIVPRMAYYLEKGEKEEFDNLLKQAFKVLTFLIMPCMAGMFIVAPEVIHLISGNNYQEFMPSILTSRILVLNLFLSPINGFLAYQIFMPHKREKIIFYATMGGAICNLVVNFILIPKFSYDGAAIATILSEGIVMVICTVLGKELIPFKGMFEGVWRYIVAALPMFLIYFGLTKINWPHYLLYLAVMVFLGALSYGAMLILLRDPLVKEELGKIKERFLPSKQ